MKNKKQIVAIVIFLVFVYLMMDLNDRLADLFRLNTQRDQMRSDVLSLSQTQQALTTQVAYATSEGAVRDWAYEFGHMDRPGDNVIIPMSPPGYTPVAPTPVTPEIEKVENWQVWYALFFGE